MLSIDGRCKTFDRGANGYARSEGVGCVVLRLGDGHGLSLFGSAVRQDGRSASLTAPNGQAQQQLMRLGIGMAGVQPRDFTLAEAHGTGTKLGDPIEAGSIAEVLLSARGPDALPPLGRAHV